MRLHHVCGVAALALAALPGCGSSNPEGPSYGGEDGRKIAQLVDLVNDEKSTAPNLARLFVKGTAPKDLRKYPGYAYDVAGEPVVTGLSATATIKMRNERDGQDVGEKEWAFEKEGEAWKIKSAPLP